MKDNHPFPLERNRYYAGKMLNSVDFQLEQTYMNCKRRFINDMMFGSGIICGLDVFSLDDLSVLIESGAAIDGLGREIVIETSIVKKLSAIEGFEQLSGEWAVLGLRYKEQEVHPVYTVAKQEEGREYECSHISEGYELFLKDRQETGGESQEKELMAEELLFEQEDYRVKLIMPANVCNGRRVKLDLLVEKVSESRQPLTLETAFQLPAFRLEDGSHNLLIELRDLVLNRGQSLRKAYWLDTAWDEEGETYIILDKSRGRAEVGGVESALPKEMKLKILLHAATPQELAAREIGRVNLEKRNLHKVQEEVDLAVFRLIRTESACMIDEIHEKEVKRYINVPADSERRNKFLSYFKEGDHTCRTGRGEKAVPSQGEMQGKAEKPTAMASGSLEIPLKMDMGKGDVCYSEEIMHGLGKGNVYVQVGIESLEDDNRLGRSTKSTIYGESGLFREERHMDIQTAVKVFNDKGSFKVAARLLGEQQSIVLLLNWVAIRFVSTQESRVNDDISNMSIVPETATVHIPVKGNFYLGVRFQNMKPCRLSYELTERGSGEITSDGVYTAPGKEGVYEIHIYCTDIPQISTYAYAVVTK